MILPCGPRTLHVHMQQMVRSTNMREHIEYHCVYALTNRFLCFAYIGLWGYTHNEGIH
jgi:hypothetical protein